MNQEISVRANECASLVGTSVSCLYRMARQNLIPVQRTGVKGRGVRFVPSEVKAALAARPAWTPREQAN
jgi:excisionase family DNA binding protein